MIRKKLFSKLGIFKREIKIEPFLAFGNLEEIFVKGRVVSAKRPPKTSSTKSILKNLWAAFTRYAISSIPNVEVEVVWENQHNIVVTNQDGVFELRIEAKVLDPLKAELVSFRIHKAEGGKNNQITYIDVRRYNAEKAIISDVDDTVIVSHSTNLGKKFWLSISKNSSTRKPLPGVSMFYRELSQNGRVPIFYISSSDWALFDLIADFLRFRKIPQGPILLKDQHINLGNILKSGRGTHHHKLDKIMMLLELYPKTNFYLIGDSGQHDPELYGEIKGKFPDRILGVFIRMVGKLDEKRRSALKSKISLDQFFFIQSSEEAFDIAKQHQFIN